MHIILEADKMATRKKAHAYLKEMLFFPDYYGNNLDALHECLTELKDVQVSFSDAQEELEKGTYFTKVFRIFTEAAQDNPGLSIIGEEEWQS